MADISKITLPNGQAYGVKDLSARASCAELSSGKADLSAVSKVFVKNADTPDYAQGRQSDLSVIKLTNGEYMQLVAEGQTSPNAEYVIADSYHCAYGLQIKNLSAGSDPDDAVTVSQISAKADVSALAGYVPLSVLSSKSSISVDGQLADVGIVHVGQDEYEQLVVKGETLSNVVYIVSSDYIDAYSRQIKYLSAGTDPDDAVTVSQLSSRLGYADVSASYAGGRIRLSAAGHVVGDIDCSDFIKDGMLSSAELCSGWLVFRFNTDAEQDAISVALSNFIDESNYYTKAELTGQNGILTGYALATRKVNGKALSADITLNAANVGALALTGGEITGSIAVSDGVESPYYGFDSTNEKCIAYEDGRIIVSLNSGSNYIYVPDTNVDDEFALSSDVAKKADLSALSGYLPLQYATGSTEKSAVQLGTRKAGSRIGQCSFAHGDDVVASRWVADAEGYCTSALANCSHAEGEGALVSADCAHAEGLNTRVFGIAAHGEGSGAFALGYASHAEGVGAVAAGQCAHAEGAQTSALGLVAHSEGNLTRASGTGSHAEGNMTVASGAFAHAEGVAIDMSGISLGDGAQAPGSHIGGFASTVSANAMASHADGFLAEAVDPFAYVWNGYAGTPPSAKGLADLIAGQQTADAQAAQQAIGAIYYQKDALKYRSQGQGTFCVNPVGGAAGFYVGGESLSSMLSPMKEVTWAELTALKSSSQLVPGMQYRITDYVATTVQASTCSASKPFDVIVVADAPNKLNENARAAEHAGNTYFSSNGADPSKWSLKYCLENDTNKFAWADSANGKGVVYWMLDEWGNECPYDFKGLKMNSATVSSAFFTFSSVSVASNATDASLDGKAKGVYGNKMEMYAQLGVRQLNRNVFKGQNCYNNVFGNGCYQNTIGSGCQQNIFGNNCYFNSIGPSCNYNVIDNYCVYINFGSSCSNNFICNSCSYVNFGNYDSHNVVYPGCQYIYFRSSSTAKNFYRYITVESGNKYIYLYCSGTTSNSSYYQNVKICSGYNNTTTYKTITDSNVGQTWQTVYGSQKLGELMGVSIPSEPTQDELASALKSVLSCLGGTVTA